MVAFEFRSPAFALCFLAALAAGCTESPAPTGSGAAAGPTASTSSAGEHHDHSGWWCTEHGVPEEQCGLCSTKLAAQFKKKGDWCKEHDRPDSQCFVCHPELEDKFVALYEAKYGEKPPARPAEEN